MNALFAGVEPPALITVPNHFNHLFWIVMLHSIAVILLHTSSFLATLLKCIDGAFCLRKCYCPDFTVVQKDRFNIDSESCHLFFWGEILAIQNGLFYICSGYSEDFSLLYIFVWSKHTTKIHTISPLMGCLTDQVLSSSIYVNHIVSGL